MVRQLRWRFATVLILSLLVGCGAPAIPTTVSTVPTTRLPIPVSADALVIENGTVIDGTGAAPIPDGAVVIQGRHIVAVGPRVDFAIPRNAQVVDAMNGTILPGFINAHVHQGYQTNHLEKWVQDGVTTVCDLGLITPLHPLVLPQKPDPNPNHARLAVAGFPITAAGGYPANIQGAAWQVTSPAEARQAVNSLADQGADIIKFYLEPGTLSKQSWPILAGEEAEAIVETAHQRNRRVVVHISSSDQLTMALEAGIDGIAHMVVDRLPQSLIERAVAQDVYWVPTLEMWKYDLGNSSDELGVVYDNLWRFVAAHGKVALGTDYAGTSHPYYQLGMPDHEIETMHLVGMSPMQIIVASTAHAAYVCNLETELGTLESGKIADVLSVDGDPLQDLQALEQIKWVIHDGVVIRSPSSKE